MSLRCKFCYFVFCCFALLQGLKRWNIKIKIPSSSSNHLSVTNSWTSWISSLFLILCLKSKVFLPAEAEYQPVSNELVQDAQAFICAKGISSGSPCTLTFPLKYEHVPVRLKAIRQENIQYYFVWWSKCSEFLWNSMSGKLPSWNTLSKKKVSSYRLLPRQGYGPHVSSYLWALTVYLADEYSICFSVKSIFPPFRDFRSELEKHAVMAWQK